MGGIKFVGLSIYRMKAIVWNRRTLGAEYLTEKFPTNLERRGGSFHAQLVENRRSENDDDICTSSRRRVISGGTEASLRKSTIALKVFR